MAKGDYPSDKADQYMVRFPQGMRDTLKAAAAAHGRSMNAEIVARLELSTLNPTDLAWREKYPDYPLSRARLDRVSAAIGDLFRDLYAKFQEASDEHLRNDEVWIALRLPANLRDDIDDIARGFGRSASEQIVELLSKNDTVNTVAGAKELENSLARLTHTELGARILGLLQDGDTFGMSEAELQFLEVKGASLGYRHRRWLVGEIVREWTKAQGFVEPEPDSTTSQPKITLTPRSKKGARDQGSDDD